MGHLAPDSNADAPVTVDELVEVCPVISHPGLPNPDERNFASLRQVLKLPL